jgi:hypothetical protein
MPKIYSQRQARFFGALIGKGGKKGLSVSKLKDALRGKKIKRLPVRSRKGG